jgi:nitrogen regulatory protein PII
MSNNNIDNQHQILHYTISAENATMDEVVNHISLSAAESQIFENSIFTIQVGYIIYVLHNNC